MARQHGEVEVEMAARTLQRDEVARRALQTPGRSTLLVVASVVFAAVQVCVHYWGEIPLYAGLALGILVGAVIALSFEVAYTRRRVDAIVQLLRLPTDA